MSNPLALSEDEMVAYLNRTSLPTILVEGSDDCLAYRYLEDKINSNNIGDVDILKCNGRDMLIKLFKRRGEFKRARVVFVADQDMWFFGSIPEEYKGEIIFTAGYSLENDLYNKTLFEGLLDTNENQSFHNLIAELAIWFAFETNRYLTTGNSLCNFHVSEICPRNSLSNEFKTKIGFTDPPIHLIQLIIQDYTRALRGKNLFEALLRFLNHSKRKSKFSRRNLIELGAKTENPRIAVLVASILNKFDQYV